MTDIDWERLGDAARRAAGRAYAPYSSFAVGAAGLTADGTLVTGGNVENASYGLSICAEVAMVCALVDGGGGDLVAVACVDAEGSELSSCGRCRQVLFEHGGANLLVNGRRLAELLPDAFGPDDLD